MESFSFTVPLPVNPRSASCDWSSISHDLTDVNHVSLVVLLSEVLVDVPPGKALLPEPHAANTPAAMTSAGVNTNSLPEKRILLTQLSPDFRNEFDTFASFS